MCYYMANPSERGYQKRMMNIWTKRNPDSDISEPRIMQQRYMVMRTKLFSEMELNEMKDQAQKVENDNNDLDESIPQQQFNISTDTNTATVTEEENVEAENYQQLNDQQKLLRERIVVHMNNGNDRHRLPPLRQIRSKPVRSLLIDINAAISTIPTVSLKETNGLMYSAAYIATLALGYKLPKQHKTKNPPKWKIRLAKKIETTRSDISCLKALKEGKLKNERIKVGLHKRYDLERKTIATVIEELKQRAVATAAKIQRYDSKIKEFTQNIQFMKNQQNFYKSLQKTEAQPDEGPGKEETLQFWKELWETPVQHNAEALWIKDVKKNNKNMKMDNIRVTVEMVQQHAKTVKNWSAPGPDELHGFWLKYLMSLHSRIATQYNNILKHSTTEDWLTSGRTYLIKKDPEKGNHPSNYRPITCLPTTFKLFTKILATTVYNHLIANDMYPTEQKGNFKKSRGTKDQLLIDKMILKNCKRRQTNLSMAWIDYKKAFDLLPHSWITTCLEIYGISENITNFVRSSMRQWSTMLTTNNTELGRVQIRRGIFQGDSLSPLLFSIALIPLSTILHKTGLGYQISAQAGKINHLLYMDDLKLYAKNNAELESLLNTVRIFSTDIKMTFGLDKCAMLSTQRGKMQKSAGLELTNGDIIRSLSKDNPYKYLGILEMDNILHERVKNLTKREYLKRVRKILKSKLNAGNTIRAINTWAMPLIRYPAGIIDWTVAELEVLDRKTRKLLTMHHSLHPKSDIDRLYLPRNIGGRGLLQVQQTVEEERCGLHDYINKSTEKFIKAVKAENFLRVMQSKIDYKKYAIKTRLDNWKDKPLHGAYLKGIENKHNEDLTWTWLKNGTLRKETEGLIFAAQDQALQTNVMQAKIQHTSDNALCRLCNNREETINHLICECSVIAHTEYKKRHDDVARKVHWALCRKYNIPTVDKPWQHVVEKVLDNGQVKILWDFRIQTDQHIAANTPDITVIEQQRATLIDIAIPGDCRVEGKEKEKIDKYRALAQETSRIWNKKTTVLPIIIGALGTISPKFIDYYNQLNTTAITPAELQKTAILGTANILRRYLSNT